MMKRLIHYFVAVMLAAGMVIPLADSARATELAASLRTQIEHFVRDRAGDSVDSISVPPLGDFEIEGIDPATVHIELSTRARGQLDGAVAVNVRISNDHAVLKRGVVTALVETSSLVYVAARDLPRGKRLMETDLRQTRVPNRSLSSKAMSNLSELVGLQLRRSINEGAIVHTRYLEPASLVERGQIVRLVVRGAGIQIVSKGRAVTDGAAGEQIRVVNTDSRREVVGRVENDGVVYVDL